MVMDLPSMHQQQLQIPSSVALAMLLGAMAGLDREFAHKPAGQCTHVLVAGAAALLMALGEVMLDHFDRKMGHAVVQSDPIHLIGSSYHRR